MLLPRFLLPALSLALVAPAANAIVIQIDTFTPTTFAFTVEWGPEQTWNDATMAQVSRPDGSGADVLGWVFVLAGQEVQGSDHLDRLDIEAHTGFPSGQTQTTFHFPTSPTDVSFASASWDANPFGMTPIITPTSDGLGARFVYDPPEAAGVPDAASGLVMLGMSACACLGLRKWM